MTPSPSAMSANSSVERTSTRITPLYPPEGTADPNGSNISNGARDKNDGVHPPSDTITARSSSSSLLEMDSTAGVAGDGDVDDENRYGLNPELEAALASASSLVEGFGEGVNSGCGDDDDDDDAIVHAIDDAIDDSNSSENDENFRGSSDNSEIWKSEKLAQIRVAFKDPFPSLTPLPSPMPSRQSLQSSHNRLNIQDKLRTPALWTLSQHNQQASQPSDNECSSGSSYTSPCTPNVPQTPPRNRVSTPQRLALPITPINTATTCNNHLTLWNDPFPTPDASVASRSRNGSDPFPTPDASVSSRTPSRFGTPCSSRMRGDNDDLDGDNYGKIMNNWEWETIMHALPEIPPIEELGSPTSEEDQNQIIPTVVNVSCPRLHSMDAAAEELHALTAELSVRRVASENDIPMVKRRSLDDLWGALEVAFESGPDGNDLETKYKKHQSIDDSKKKKEGRNSEKGENSNWDNPMENSGIDKPLHRRMSKEQIVNKNLTASAEPSWEGLRRRRPLNLTHLDTNDKSNGDINANVCLKNHRNTLSNVTGANLAREVKMLINQRAPKEQPDRLSFRAWKALKSSRAVANVRNSAGELVFSPVRTASQRAVKLVKNTRKRMEEKKELRRQRRLARIKEPPPSWWIVIPADHPYKIAWDTLTMLWALLGAYRTHVRIRDRAFEQSPLIIVTEVMFTIDILLNFVTEHKTSKGEVIRDGKAIWARYLTTWFLIDILSLIPWERIYVRPLVEKIKKRNFFQKTFFRSKAVVRVSRVLRGRHIKLFGRVSKQTGTPLRRLVALVIKYLPKYLVFLRNMKGALVVRALRFIHWLHNMYKGLWVKARRASQNLAAGRASKYSLFSLVRTSENNDSDSNGDVDSDEEDDELDLENESDDDDDGSLVLIDTHDYSELTSFHRAHREGSPLLQQRRRSLSMMTENDIWLRDYTDDL